MTQTDNAHTPSLQEFALKGFHNSFQVKIVSTPTEEGCRVVEVICGSVLRSWPDHGLLTYLDAFDLAKELSEIKLLDGRVGIRGLDVPDTLPLLSKYAPTCPRCKEEWDKLSPISPPVTESAGSAPLSPRVEKLPKAVPAMRAERTVQSAQRIGERKFNKMVWCPLPGETDAFIKSVYDHPGTWVRFPGILKKRTPLNTVYVRAQTLYGDTWTTKTTRNANGNMMGYLKYLGPKVTKA